MKTPKLLQPRSCAAALGLALLLPVSLQAAVTVKYTTSGTFTAPAGVTNIIVECWGGGGAGGGSFITSAGSANAGGGGGGGGAYARLNAVPVTPGADYTITIPAAATCPASGFINGQTYDGAAVSFTGDSGVTVTADGGKGGGCSVVTSSTAISGTAGLGGDAGTGLDGAWKGGNAVFWAAGNGGGGGGGAGDLGAGANSAASNGSFGAGGLGSDADHTGGNGGAARNGAGSGNAAASPGGGGGGAKSTPSSKSSKAGGAGGSGQIIITYSAPIVKADNTNNLDQTSSWVGGAVPGPENDATWDGTVTAANTVSLGADLTFAGISIVSPTGLVTVNAGNTLTLGASTVDIDMTAATANLTLNCDLVLGAANVWDVTTGQTLTVGGVVSGPGTLTKQGAGEVILSGDNTFTNKLNVVDGTLTLTGNRTVAPALTPSIDVGGTSIPLATLNLGGDFNFGGTQLRVGINGPGTVNHTNGAVAFTGGSQVTVGITAGMAGIYNLSGGTLTTTNVTDRGLLLGVNANCTGTFNLSDSGTLTMPSGSVLQICRSESSGSVSGTTGTFNQTGGAATVGVLRLGGGNANNANTTAALNLSGGTFSASTFGSFSAGSNSTSTIDISGTADVTLPAFPITRGSGATATLTFDGGLLRNAATSANYMSNLTAAYIKAGGARFNTDNGSITIAQPLETDLVSSGGGLTKEGTNTLTLTGTPTYTGPTLVNAGRLVVPSTHAGTGAATVSANAALGVTASGTSQWQPSSLTLANPCTLEFNSVQNSGTTTAPILPGSPVGAVTNVTININSALGTLFVNDSYPLLGQVSATNGYALGTQPPGITGRLEVSSDTLVYVVDSALDVWTGNDGTNPTWWDIATTVNWTGGALLNTPSGSYADGDGVLFDDTAAPASPVTVDIQTAVAPGTTLFDNSAKDYMVTNSGAFGIGGSGSLTKSGSGTLTLASPNTYTGATLISGGTLDLTGSLSNSSVTVSGSAVLSQAASGSIGGAATVTHASSGTSTLAGANTYSGGTTNSGVNGIVAVNHADALGTGPFNFAGGRRLVVATGLEVTNSIIIGGNSGQIGRGLVEPGTSAGTATISGPIAINNGAAGGGIFAAPTAGTVLRVAGPITSAVNVSSRDGTVEFSGGGTGYTNLINNEGTIRVGAVNGIATTANVSVGASGAGNLDLNGFNQSLVGIAAGGSAANATITNSSATPAVLTLTGTSSYAGTIKDDGGTGTIALTVAGGDLTLRGVNTYSGTTIVNAGTLNVSNNLALQNSALITTGAGTLTLGDGITTPTIGGLSGASGDLATIITSGYGNVTALTLNPLSGTVTYGGEIADGAAGMTLTKSGAGTQVLNGASTFTGNLSVSAGTLQLGADNRLSATAGLDLAPNGTTSAILDLNGYDQTLSRLIFSETNAAGNLTITGGANSTLTINTTNNTEIGPGGSLTANRNVTNDMSGLGQFIWNGSANTFRVGVRFGASNPSGTPGVTDVSLADRNTITAAQLAIGTVGASSAGGTSFLHLGTTNVVNASTINIGTSGRSYSTLNFRAGLVSPKVTIRGTDGTSAVGAWDAGKVAHFNNTIFTTTVDFSGGELDALVGSLRIGMADTAGQTGRQGTQNATFTMGKGTLNVTNLNLGMLLGGGGVAGTTYIGNGTFILNDANGILTAENIILGTINHTYTNTVATIGTASANGTFNLGAGTLVAKSIDRGTQSGLGTSTQNFNFTNGTVRNHPGFGLAVSNVPVNLTGSGTRIFEATAGQTISVASVISDSGGGQGFTKTGAGTLTLSDANTYGGPTLINSGTLFVNNTTGSGTGTGDVTVNNGGTLGGTGSIAGNVLVNAGGGLAPGASIGTLSVNGALTLSAGSTNVFEVNGTTPTNDTVVLGSTVTYGGVLNIVPTGTFTNGQTFTLFSGAGATDPSNFASVESASGVFSFANGVLTVVTAPVTGPSGPATLNQSVSGNTLTLTWPAGQNWRLVGQTNSLSTGLNPATNAWFTVPGGIDGSNSIPINSANPTVFYRLVYP